MSKSFGAYLPIYVSASNLKPFIDADLALALEDKMVEVGDRALELIGSYFAGENDKTDEPKIEKAFRFIGHPIKVMHMQQHRMLQERSQAIRLLKYLQTDEDRAEYIKMTQPQAAPLLEHRPKK